MSKVLIIGAGFAGATTAYLLKKQGYDVTVLEGGSHPGGGCWTQTCGGHPYTFGPRIFFTYDDEIITQMTDLVKFRNFDTKTWTYVAQDGELYNYPLQYSDIDLMPDKEQINNELKERKDKTPKVDDFESYWMDAIGPTLYNKFVNSYSKKMWGVDTNKELLANFEWVNKGTPIRDGDNRLYKDQFQGYPEGLDGYNTYFINALKDCKVEYNCIVKQFDPVKRTFETSKGEYYGDIIVNTVHVDAMFGFAYGRLKFCGRDFIPLVLPVEQALPDDVTWVHYSGNEPYTRVTEFKKITNYQSKHTLLGIEFPSDRGRIYPVQSKPELARLEQYKQLFPKDFYSIGRLGRFKYQGIPEAIKDGIEVAKAVGKCNVSV